MRFNICFTQLKKCGRICPLAEPGTREGIISVPCNVAKNKVKLFINKCLLDEAF